MLIPKLKAKDHILATVNTTLDEKEDVCDTIDNVARAMESFADKAVELALDNAYKNSALNVISLVVKGKEWKKNSFKTAEVEVFIDRNSIINNKVNFQ